MSEKRTNNWTAPLRNRAHWNRSIEHANKLPKKSSGHA